VASNGINKNSKESEEVRKRLKRSKRGMDMFSQLADVIGSQSIIYKSYSHDFRK